MLDHQPAVSANRELATKIVAAYVRRHQVGADQIGNLISNVHHALAGLGKPETETTGDRKPAVSARQSVHRDYVVCMDCGWKGSMLRRHLTTAHASTTDEYRARWHLKSDHPVTAPGYSERRSAMAKQIGLGRTRGVSAETMAVPEMETATTTPPGPKRRERSRTPSS